MRSATIEKRARNLADRIAKAQSNLGDLEAQMLDISNIWVKLTMRLQRLLLVLLSLLMRAKRPRPRVRFLFACT